MGQQHLSGILPDEHHEEDGRRERHQHPVTHISVEQYVMSPHRR